MTAIFFLFVGEGSSDAALVPHLEDLCLLCGADEATGLAPNLESMPRKISRTVREKLHAAMELEPNADLIFVHRDADSTDPDPRYSEIHSARSTLESDASIVPLVPVQETEAWLLLDKEAIRRVADNPNGKVPLQLPPLKQIEKLAKPKERLFKSLETASGLKGRRLAKFKQTLPRRRRLLLERLSTTGPLTRLPAWQRLNRDLKRAILDLQKSRPRSVS